MKNILLLVHDDDGQEARLQAALDLTRATDGHLTCIDVTPVPLFMGNYLGVGGEALLLAEARERETRNKAVLEARLAHEDIAWQWIDVTGDFADALLDAATLADIIVLNRKLDQFPNPDMHDIASRILMHARTPVLAMPETARRLALKRALIAWDGRPSCAATLRATIPMLRLADEIEIFTVRDGSEKVEPTEAAAYLSRHDIHATVRIIDDGLHSPSQLIAEEAIAWRADYVLMGAYGHGRMVQMFGGVTKRMLNKARLPLVLGH